MSTKNCSECYKYKKENFCARCGRDMTKIISLNIYEDIIIKFATKHYEGDMDIKSEDYDWELRDKVVKYAEENDRRVKDILSDIGYSFYTCTNHSPFYEIISIIKGEPYFEYVANEINPDSKEIKVNYYKHLLKNNIFDVKQFIKGKYYDSSFNADTFHFHVKDGSIVLILKKNMVGYKYTHLLYKAFYASELSL